MAEPYRKKLIEVALPLEAINHGAAHEKRSTFLRGHPRSIHHWWARRPLAACRAVLFASIVDDPSSRPDLFPTEKEQEVERQRLFRIIEELVRWENTTSETVLEAARAEIRRATDGNPPPVLDPFCGGGSIPLEAQRLGLETHASDLNPVAVLMTKALIELPPRFADKPPVNPEAKSKLAHGATWNGAQGLAEDVRYYGSWMRDRAFERIGHLYPKAKLPEGGEATVIAWLWARTVTCPNPACGVEMPLVRSFALSSKRGREWHIEPEFDGRVVHFEVRPGKTAREGTVGRGGARCVVCATVIPLAQIRAAGQAGQIGQRLLAIVAEGARGRVYLSPSDDHEAVAQSVAAENGPETELPSRALGFRVQAYGLTRHCDLFSPRQLTALGTLCDLVQDVRAEVLRDGRSSPYADAVATYMALAVGKLVPYLSSLTTWHNGGEQLQSVFARQSLSMVWDYAESSPLGKSLGLGRATQAIAEILHDLPATPPGDVKQLDAAAALPASDGMVVTDPPYYDNIGYADLADVFYVWLKRALRDIHPQLFSTVLSPKRDELIADPHRFDGGEAEAKTYFERGLRAAFSLTRKVQESSGQPLVFYYAFKQAEEEGREGSRGAHVSTGWETMLEGLIDSGFSITATWPIRTEGETRSRNRGGFNALASSVVLVCRPRSPDAVLATRGDFISALSSDPPIGTVG